MKKFSKILLFGAIISGLSVYAFFSRTTVSQAAGTCTATATGNWNTIGTWDCGRVPLSDDDVVITSAVATTITVDTAAVANSVTITNTAVASTQNVILAVGANSLTITSPGGITINGGGALNRNAQVTVSTGTITVPGSVTFNNARAQFISTGASTTTIGGNFGSGGTLTTSGTGTINFNGGVAQTIGLYTTYNNIQINNAGGNVTFNAGTTTIGGTLLVNTGILDVAGVTLNVTGATTINSILQISNATGTKTFNNDITVASGGALNFVTAVETLNEVGNLTVASGGTIGFSVASVISLNGNLAVNGTGTITGTSGTWAFLRTGGGGTISGTASSITLTAATFTTAYALNIPATIATVTATATTFTNNSTLTVNTALSGTGQLTQGTGSVLNLGGTSGITTLDASASTNEVHYTSTAANQTLHTGTYHHLFIEKTGRVGTLGGVATINGNLTVTAGTLADGGFQITGNPTGTLSLAAGTTLTLGAAAATLFPTAYTTGTILLNATSTINYNSNAAQTISDVPSYTNLTTTATAPVTKTAAGAFTVNGTFTNGTNNIFADGGFTITLKGNGTMTGSHTGAGKILFTGGTAAHSVIGTPGSYNNVELDDTNGVTQTGTTNIGGTLTITSGSWGPSGNTLLVTGATSVFSTIAITSTAGTKTFGDLTINNGGTLSFTAAEAITMNGNLTIDGTGVITGTTGLWTFQKTGGGGTIGGTSVGTLSLGSATFTTSYSLGLISIIPTVTVTGTTLTNNATLTVNTALSGTGQLTQGSGSVLNLGGTSGITTLVSSASTNEVHYTSTTAAQTIHTATYHHLFVDKAGQTGTVGTPGMTVNGNLTVTAGNLADGGFQITGNATGTLTIPAASTLTLGLAAAATSFPTAFTNVNILLNTTSTVNYNSTAAQTISDVPTYGNLTLTGAAVTKTAAGAITINGNFSNATATGVFVDGGFIITVKGNSTMTGTHTGAGKIFFTDGTAAHSVAGTGSYNNVELNGTNGVTQTGTTNIGGTFTITSGTWSPTGQNLTVTGDTSISGTLSITSVTNAKNLRNVTINSGGLITFSAVEALGVAGDLTVNGTGATTGTSGAWAFSKVGGGTISGTATGITITAATFTTNYALNIPASIATVTVTGAAVVLTNNTTLTVNTSLAGTGTLTQSIGTLLNLGGAATITTLDASVNSNEVHYTSTTAGQTVKSANYYNLFIDKSGQTALFAGTPNVLGDLVLSAGTIGIQAATLTVTGTTSIHGSLQDLNDTGSTTFGGLVTVFSDGSWDCIPAENAAFNFSNGLDFDGTAFVSGPGLYTFLNNDQSITGASAVAIDNMVVTGIQLTNSNTASVTTSDSLSGTGEFIQDTNAVLNIEGTSTIATLTATASGNSVNYNGAAAQTVHDGTYQTLTVNGNTNGNVDITADTTANAALTLGATIFSTGANRMIMGAGSTVSRTTGFINGNLQKNVPTGSPLQSFEIGSGADYTPVDLSFSGVTVAGDLLVNTTASDHVSIATSGIIASKSANRFYTASNSGISFGTYDAAFTFVPTDVDAGANTANFVLEKFDSGAWSRPTLGTVTATSVAATGMTTFSDFQIGEPIATPPPPTPTPTPTPSGGGSSSSGFIPGFSNIPGFPNTGLVPPIIRVTKVQSPVTLPAEGGMVTFTVQASNPGVFALINVRITDDACAPIVYVSGDTDSDAKLDTTETWIYACSTVLTRNTVSTTIAVGEANGLVVSDSAAAVILLTVPGISRLPVPAPQLPDIVASPSSASPGLSTPGPELPDTGPATEENMSSVYNAALIHFLILLSTMLSAALRKRKHRR